MIAELTQENLKLLSELQERDQKHMMLEKKMGDVHVHVNDVTNTLNEYLSENMTIAEKNEQLEKKLIK